VSSLDPQAAVLAGHLKRRFHVTLPICCAGLDLGIWENVILTVYAVLADRQQQQQTNKHKISRF